MRPRWVDYALIALIGLFVVNQYPVWGAQGSEQVSVAVNFQIGYLLAGALALLAGLGLYLWGLRSGRELREAALALCVLGGGLYVHYSLMVLAQRSMGVAYAQVAAPVAAVLVLALVISARWTDEDEQATGRPARE